jgi:hypothetical protein
MLTLGDDAALKKNVGELLIGGSGRACLLDAGYIGRAEDAFGLEQFHERVGRRGVALLLRVLN